MPQMPELYNNKEAVWHEDQTAPLPHTEDHPLSS